MGRRQSFPGRGDREEAKKREHRAGSKAGKMLRAVGGRGRGGVGERGDMRRGRGDQGDRADRDRGGSRQRKDGDQGWVTSEARLGVPGTACRALQVLESQCCLDPTAGRVSLGGLELTVE